MVFLQCLEALSLAPKPLVQTLAQLHKRAEVNLRNRVRLVKNDLALLTAEYDGRPCVVARGKVSVGHGDDKLPPVCQAAEGFVAVFA
jgi:hypothetical protein